MIVVVVFAAFGIRNLYLLHGVVLDSLSVKEAGTQSKKLMKVFLIVGTIIFDFAALFATPLYIMKMTQLFYTYKTGETRLFEVREKKKHPFVWTGVIILIAIVVFATALLNRSFDLAFPLESTVGIIGHRAGGIEAPENTVTGLDAAYSYGAFGSEIDIQRTKDGHYVINHDGTFARVTGDSRRPS